MANFSRTSVSFSRRSFVQKMGLGMGASLLGPLAKNLIREAQGQANGRRIFLYFSAPNGINPGYIFSPGGALQDNNTLNEGIPSPSSSANTTDFTLPEAFSPLDKSQVLMLDGFQNHPRKGEDGGHSMGYMALTCVPGTDIDHLKPGGISFDQHVANTLSADAPRKSILVGISSHQDQDMKDMSFALGPDKPISAFQNPSLLFKDLFGSAMASAGGMGKPNNRNRLLFDGLRYDIPRLESQLAGPEKNKLSQYLATIESYEKSLAAASSLTCSTPAATTQTQAGDAVPVLESLQTMGAIALLCGMTNVMCVDVGNGDSHDWGPNVDTLLTRTNTPIPEGSSLGDVGHMEMPIQKPVIDATYKWLSGMAQTTLNTLKATAGVQSAFALIQSDNGETHHSGHGRWPAVLVGDAGSMAKFNGRFVRMQGQPLLFDMYLALLQSLGIPQGEFGKHSDGMGPNNAYGEPQVQSKGPLPQIFG